MKKKTSMVALLVITAIFSLCACSKKSANEEALNKLVFDLEAKNYTITTEISESESDFIPGEQRILKLGNDEQIVVYLFKSEETAKKEASYIDEGGSGYYNGKRGVEVEWISYPHFYLMENAIVQYIGENPEILADLEELLGKQFAGML